MKEPSYDSWRAQENCKRVVRRGWSSAKDGLETELQAHTCRDRHTCAGTDTHMQGQTHTCMDRHRDRHTHKLPLLCWKTRHQNGNHRSGWKFPLIILSVWLECRSLFPVRKMYETNLVKSEDIEKLTLCLKIWAYRIFKTWLFLPKASG